MILPIARAGHPILQKRAEEIKIDEIGSSALQKLIADMIETCYAADAAGLAAPQVFHSLRLVVFEIPEERAKLRNQAPVPLTILINPIIEPLTDEKELSWEACLSIPDMMGAVPRYRAIRYSALNEKGQYFQREAEGYHARAVQHECDHLDGILYPFRMPDMQQFGYIEEIKQAMAKS